jgi:hypothetical protein
LYSTLEVGEPTLKLEVPLNYINLFGMGCEIAMTSIQRETAPLFDVLLHKTGESLSAY